MPPISPQIDSVSKTIESVLYELVQIARTKTGGSKDDKMMTKT